jgi:hypothetical protein
MYKYLYFLIFLFGLLISGCGGESYMPERFVVDLFAYDENTNGIPGLKVTIVMTTNGVSDTDVQYTDTNGYACSKVFVINYKELKIPPSDYMKIFDVTIEDIDGISNGGEFATTNFKPLDDIPRIIMRRK